MLQVSNNQNLLVALVKMLFIGIYGKKRGPQMIGKTQPSNLEDGEVTLITGFP